MKTLGKRECQLVLRNIVVHNVGYGDPNYHNISCQVIDLVAFSHVDSATPSRRRIPSKIDYLQILIHGVQR